MFVKQSNGSECMCCWPVADPDQAFQGVVK